MNTSSYAVTAGNCCNSSQPLSPKPAEIPAAFEQLEKAVEDMDKTVAVLREQLEPTMNQVPPPTAGPRGTEGAPPPSSQISARLRESACRVSNITSGLSRILERLEV